VLRFAVVPVLDEARRQQRVPRPAPNRGRPDRSPVRPRVVGGDSLRALQRLAGNAVVDGLVAQAACQRTSVQRRSLTEEERAVDLNSERLRDDDRLERAFDNSPPMKFGETGPAVATLQQALVEIGFSMPRSTRKGAAAPDGIFGSETLRVVKGFQTMQGVSPDGEVGRRTLGELDGRLTGEKPPGSGASGPEPAGSVTVTRVDVVPPTFLECGGFRRLMDWVTNARNGYLVQEIRATRSATRCDGGIDDAETVTPRFWEAWRVQEDGSVHPRLSGAHDTWARGVVPETTGTWTIVGDLHFVEQLDPDAGFTNTSGTEAGGLYATTTQPGNLGTIIFSHSAGGVWNCCIEPKTHVPIPLDEGDESPSANQAAGPAQPAASELAPPGADVEAFGPQGGNTGETSPAAALDGPAGGDPLVGYTQCDFIDERISVEAQFALHALNRRGGHDRADAVAMLSAVKAEAIQGVFEVDQQKPALMAQRHGTVWWELIPAGQDALVFEDESPPMMVFRPGVASDRQALATALATAWDSSATSGQSIARTPPSGETCPINLAPVEIEGERPPGQPEPPSGPPLKCDEKVDFESRFPQQRDFCEAIRSQIEIFCNFVPEFEKRTLPQFKQCRDLDEIPHDTAVEDCVVNQAFSDFMTEGCPPDQPGPLIPAEPGPIRDRIRRRFRAFRGR
jgi:peptidoglycan hydrolase-like protein with peptidoglycan-binding domain